jgi:transketolase
MEQKELEALSQKAAEIRKLTIDEIGYLGLGHIGGAMSVIEVLTVLYYKYMFVEPSQPRHPDRDIFVLSKGHAGPALYAVLASKGFFPIEELHTLNRPDTRLPSHCDRLLTPGMDMTAGSLGQGLSAAIGFAIAAKLDNHPKTVYCLIGDGESNEGQIWEAAMSAAHYGLGNLIAFTDCNKLQLDSWTKDIMNVEDLKSKWEAFNWHTQRIDGHDIQLIDEAVKQAKSVEDRPSMIVLDTVKGKGAAFAENRADNHHMVFSYQQAKDAIEILNSTPAK